jgi:polysaccharide biosynthesis transport protein
MDAPTRPLSGVCVELRDYVRILRSRIWLIGACVGVVVVAAVVISFLQKPTYQGVSEVVVTQQNTGITMLGTPQPDTGYQPGRDDVQTQADVIASPRIARQVITALGLQTTVDALMSRVTASADSGTNIVTVRAVDPSPERAAQIANAFADAYISWSRDSQRASIKAAADDVERRLVEAQEQIVALDSAGGMGSVANQVKLQAAKDLYTSLADKLQQLRIAEQLATGKGSLLTSATVDPVKVSPSYRNNLALALALGLLVGLAAAFIAEQLDTRIKSVDEVPSLCGAPILATIPDVKARAEGPDQVALAQRSDNAESQAYRMLRNSLDFINIDGDIKTVLVTSAVPNEGKSSVAANLAIVLAQAGKQVYLVACDFWLPAADRFFDLDARLGLSDVLRGAARVEQITQRPKGLENLWILPAGSTPPNPSELLGSAAMGTMLAGLRKSVDWVIIDSSPVLATADAVAVSRWADRVLLVARVGVSKRDSTRDACMHLANVGKPVVGEVVLAPAENVAAGGYYGYHAGRL